MARVSHDPVRRREWGYPELHERATRIAGGLADCAGFGIPDEEYGESLAAHIELDPGSQVTEEDLREYVRTALASYKVPKVRVFVDELPRGDSGKLFKRLCEPYWAAGRNA